MPKPAILSRRKFIQLLAVAASSLPLSSLASNRLLTPTSTNSDAIELDVIRTEPWRTLFEVQEHLFPTEKNSLGSQDINALGYLQGIMNTPEFDGKEKTLIHNGVVWLNDLAKQQYSKTFIDLNLKDKEKILRRIENSSKGERWLSLVLTYILQALLTDPIYGGNSNGIGWKWLGHKPGFPLPVENKKYFKLKQKRTRTIKA